ncbi:MAG: hypothetical protein JWM68_3550 [Verrucomicrobiales bacterium]|nr:hypothetical protein [Verrucomicrobiales bacterium]
MTNSKPHLLGLLAGLFLAVGLLLSAMVVTRAWLKISESQTISVTGSARKNVKSDMIVWRGMFSVEGSTLLDAQRQLKADLTKVETFLHAKGITNYTVDPIAIQEMKARGKREDEPSDKTVGYRLSHTVQIRSSQVEQVAQLDRETTVLIEQGVLFTTFPPEYIYTKAGEAKIEMLAEATKDARARAEQIASQGARRISQLRAARVGVFQVTPLHSSMTSSEGFNDTSSLEKTITAVVTTTFSLK